VRDPFANIPDETKHLIDTASVITAGATIIAWLPAISALFSIIWMGIRIYESKTVQRLLGRQGDLK